MKHLTTETTTKGIAPAHVHDYQSGVEIGRATADWDQYRLRADGPSDVCEARRCLNRSEIERLEIDGETVIFLLDEDFANR